MKKLIALFALVATVAVTSAFAEDSYLYWLVDTSADSSLKWQYAELFAKNGDSVRSLDIADTSVASAPATTTLGDYVGAGWSYYVELLNDVSEGAEAAGVSSYLSYDALVSAGSIRKQSSTTSVSPATFSIENVPEPTSGMMLLLGFAMLGLKRKRA